MDSKNIMVGSLSFILQGVLLFFHLVKWLVVLINDLFVLFYFLTDILKRQDNIFILTKSIMSSHTFFKEWKTDFPQKNYIQDYVQQFNIYSIEL